MKKENNYLRIGTEYYKKGLVPLYSGDTHSALLKWKKGEVITDEGKDFLQEIEKFDGFCLIPSHTDYEQKIKNFYNRYEKVEHLFLMGDFPKTKEFLKHLFGEQYDIGLDYLSILWKHPCQILPVLCLVSEDRKTGKTTFLNWLKLVFQGNMTINTNEDLRSRFNTDWTSKLIVSVDEVLLDRKEDSERIKNLATSNSAKTEGKGDNKDEGLFFGKFILCSNNEENFIIVDKEEIRYWVRKVPSLPDVNENPNLLSDLEKELPYFMSFLKERRIISPKKTRMWFTKEQIFTKALSKLVKGNTTNLNKEIQEILIDDFCTYDVDILKYSLRDLVKVLSKNNVRVSSSKVSEVLKNSFNLESKNGSYSKFYLNNSFVEELKQKGRYFSFKKEDFIKE